MHSHCEIIIPPTDDIPAFIEEIMKPYSEHEDDSDGFWDWYVIGGRLSGEKLEVRLDKQRIEEFFVELKERGFKVSSIQAGKQMIVPSAATFEVDMLYRKWFPGHGEVCPFFSHYWDQYAEEGINPIDVCTVEELPENLICDRLMIAGPHWSEAGKFIVKYMYTVEFWNGVNHQKTDFNGNVKAVTDLLLQSKDVWFTKDWLAVTVDYHS